ncbi:MAG: recombination-associated protein RdgC, partial [Aeromonadaceae bacterium]
MWFKNLQLYRFTRPFELDADALEKLLEGMAFTPCGSQDISKFGWTTPLGKGTAALVHEAAGQLLLCARKEEKMLPSSVVKEMLDEKVEALEAEQGRGLKKKEKEALKEEILMTLLPRAFTRHSQTFLWINPADGYVAVDAGSVKKADDVLALLRKSIGSLPVVPLALKNPPEITMTEWLNGTTPPAGFTLGDEVELRSALEHGGIIRAKEQDLLSEEMKAHLLADKLVTKLALEWADTVSFVLGDDLSIKRLKF